MESLYRTIVIVFGCLVLSWLGVWDWLVLMIAFLGIVSFLND